MSNTADVPFIPNIRTPAKRTAHRRSEDDDKGSVQDCFSCSLAFFSHWETHLPFSKTKQTPDPEDLECGSCVTERLYLRNMQALQKQQGKK